jgi:hypothetical protein
MDSQETAMSTDGSSPLTEGDRDLVVHRAQEAFATGQISHDDLVAHLDVVLTARTSADLVPVLAVLPVPGAGRTLALTGMNGWFRRDGVWRVPGAITVESEYGKVDLDLSRAIFEEPSVDITLQLTYGRARITVPADAVVDLDSLTTVWKQPRYRAPKGAGTGGPTIRIDGTMEYGRLKVRHARR